MTLREAVLNSLPESAARLLGELEAFAGSALAITLSNADSPAPDTTSVEFLHDGAKIWLPRSGDIDPHALTHELLHAQRYWLEGVPRMMPAEKRPELVQVCNEVDNALEHLIIIPRERDHGFDPTPFRLEEARREWAKLEVEAAVAHPTAIQRNGLLKWAAIQYFGDDVAVRSEAERILRTRGLYDRAQSFADEIALSIADKPRMIRACATYFEIPPAALTLFWTDPREGFRETPLISS